MTMLASLMRNIALMVGRLVQEVDAEPDGWSRVYPAIYRNRQNVRQGSLSPGLNSLFVCLFGWLVQCFRYR